MKILVIIPAFNEEKSIEKTIYSIRMSGIKADIIVINDGSTDSTSVLAKRAGANVIDLPVNLGIGGAVQTGYLYAFYNNYDIAVQVDGDGQHDGKELNKIVSALNKNEADIVIGSRFVKKSNYKADLLRSWGIKYFSKLVSMLIRYPVFDVTSGYRGINKKGLMIFSQYYPRDYPEVETLVYAYRKGLSIKEIPVNMRLRSHGRSSISFWDGLYYMIKVTIMIILNPVLSINKQN